MVTAAASIAAEASGPRRDSMGEYSGSAERLQLFFRSHISIGCWIASMATICPL